MLLEEVVNVYVLSHWMDMPRAVCSSTSPFLQATPSLTAVAAAAMFVLNSLTS